MAATLVVLFLGPVLLLAGQQGRSAIIAALADPASLLASRSPGSRPGGALTQTKADRRASRTAGRPRGPIERVLSNVRTRPPAAGVVAAPDGAALFTPGTPGDALVGSPGPSSAGVGPGGIGPIGGGIGGGGGGGGVGGGGGTVVPPVAAVPEPATWVAMILGFFGVGAAARRRRSGARSRGAVTQPARGQG